MKKYNTYNIVLEFLSIVLSVVFAKFLNNIDLIFLYKYILLLVIFVILTLLKITLNQKIMKILFYSNLLLISTYYIVNFILHLY